VGWIPVPGTRRKFYVYPTFFFPSETAVHVDHPANLTSRPNLPFELRKMERDCTNGHEAVVRRPTPLFPPPLLPNGNDTQLLAFPDIRSIDGTGIPGSVTLRDLVPSTFPCRENAR